MDQFQFIIKISFMQLVKEIKKCIKLKLMKTKQSAKIFKLKTNYLNY